MQTIVRAFRIALAGVVLGATTLAAQITTPRQALGFDIGDDYHLANYTQFEAYWKTLASESPRMVLEEIGKTEEGRSQWMAIITSPENHRNLDRYREIARRLALAEGLTDDEAHALAREGKAVVWIDGGLHATEVLGAHQLMEFVYEMVSRQDDETMRFLNDVIVLAVHANPDGMQLVSDWYMRKEDPSQRSTSGIPVLYQHYVGHDNNRDFYMSTQSETINMNRIMYKVWFPQIVYNHHQTGPAGAVMFGPPFRDPFNYHFDPLVPLGIEAVGTAMHSRMVAEGKGGTTMRSGASYSTWWNGGLRTTPYFHNIIGLLTETIGNPTPVEVPFIPDRQLPHNDLPLPVTPGPWHFVQSIQYSQTANRAVLNYASRNREDLLFNIYRMGSNAITRGNSDTWTVHPQLITAAKEAGGQGGRGAPAAGGGGFRGNRGLSLDVYRDVLRNPDNRDPRGYILPADQVDFPTATKFVNVLIRNGITVQRATREFAVNGKTYPAGSYVVKTAQAFAPFVYDMFEPQDHPDDFEYPGGPPISPYDNTGWTVSLQMGVEVDRILTGFDGPFEAVEGEASPPAGMVANAEGARGFLMSHAQNDGFILTNRLLANRDRVYWLTESFTAGGTTWPAGTVYIPASNRSRREVNRAAAELGLSFTGVSSSPEAAAVQIRPVRVGLWDRYGGSIPSGWARWIMEQFEFPFELVYPPRLDAGNLKNQFDVLIFPNGAISNGEGGGGGFGRPNRADIPAQYQDRLGNVTAEATVPQLQRFLEQGGSIITIGSSTSLGNQLGLGLENYLVDDGGRPLGRERYFVPGSILQVQIDNTRPVAYGMPSDVNVHFNNSPVFARPMANPDVTSIGWFDSDHPLLSGWAWGQEALDGGVTMLQAQFRDGTLYLFGPEVIRRGQPHGTFKFLFNGILLSNSRSVSKP